MSAATQSSADPEDRRDGGVRDLTDREVRALTEPLVVVANRGAVRGAEGLAHVYAADGDRYLVDYLHAGKCQCPDSRFRDGVTCKHVIVAQLWSDEHPREIPAFVDESAVDRNTLRAAREASEQ
jgi:hypothetical protein